MIDILRNTLDMPLYRVKHSGAFASCLHFVIHRAHTNKKPHSNSTSYITHATLQSQFFCNLWNPQKNINRLHPIPHYTCHFTKSIIQERVRRVIPQKRESLWVPLINQ